MDSTAFFSAALQHISSQGMDVKQGKLRQGDDRERETGDAGRRCREDSRNEGCLNVFKTCIAVFQLPESLEGACMCLNN